MLGAEYVRGAPTRASKCSTSGTPTCQLGGWMDGDEKRILDGVGSGNVVMVSLIGHEGMSTPQDACGQFWEPAAAARLVPGKGSVWSCLQHSYIVARRSIVNLSYYCWWLNYYCCHLGRRRYGTWTQSARGRLLAVHYEHYSSSHACRSRAACSRVV